MKKSIIFLLISACSFNCTEKKKTIDFATLKATEFNANGLEIHDSKIGDSLKQVHDSCMGFAFDANVFLARSKDTFFIGSIVNRQTLKTVNTLQDLGLTRAQLFSYFNVLTNPCYEKRVLHFPLKSILGENFNLQFPGAGAAFNKQINDAISASADAEMQTGSWVYLDMKDALKKILDTISNPAGLRYKENILDTSNMVFTAAESVTEISFIINTDKDISGPLQAFLQTKPSLLQQNSRSSIQLFYLNGNKFQMTFQGFFPVAGQFMKAEMK